MKKSLLIVGLLAIALTACKIGEAPKEEQSPATEEAATAPAASEATQNDQAAPADVAPPAAEEASSDNTETKDAQ